MQAVIGLLLVAVGCFIAGYQVRALVVETKPLWADDEGDDYTTWKYN